MKILTLSILTIAGLILCSLLTKNVLGCGTCTKDNGTSTACFCGPSYYECSVKKERKLCEGTTPSSCVDINKYASATGSNYQSAASAANRKCNGADYCPVINWKGVNYTGSNTCFVLYAGCN